MRLLGNSIHFITIASAFNLLFAPNFSLLSDTIPHNFCDLELFIVIFDIWMLASSDNLVGGQEIKIPECEKEFDAKTAFSGAAICIFSSK